MPSRYPLGRYSQGTSRGVVAVGAAAALAAALPPFLRAAAAAAAAGAPVFLLLVGANVSPPPFLVFCRGSGKEGELGGARVLFVPHGPVGHGDS